MKFKFIAIALIIIGCASHDIQTRKVERVITGVHPRQDKQCEYVISDEKTIKTYFIDACNVYNLNDTITMEEEIR